MWKLLHESVVQLFACQCCDGNCPSCTMICGKMLGCRQHKCPSICHRGSCTLSLLFYASATIFSMCIRLVWNTRVASCTLFSYESLGSMALEFSRKCEMLRCENSTLATIWPLLLINGIDVTILWAGLAKHRKEITCSRNLIAACDFYDARRTFCASSYENLVEKSARHASEVSSVTVFRPLNHPIIN